MTIVPSVLLMTATSLVLTDLVSSFFSDGFEASWFAFVVSWADAETRPSTRLNAKTVVRHFIKAKSFHEAGGLSRADLISQKGRNTPHFSSFPHRRN